MIENVKKTVFPNGLTLISEQMSSVRSVSVGIFLRTGSRQERESENGISHFIEHMLFKGTKRRTAEEIARTRKLSTCVVRITGQHDELVALFKGVAYIKGSPLEA